MAMSELVDASSLVSLPENICLWAIGSLNLGLVVSRTCKGDIDWDFGHLFTDRDRAEDSYSEALDSLKFSILSNQGVTTP